MKTLFSHSVLAAAFILALSVTAPVMAADPPASGAPPAPLIIIVDFQRILQESKAGKAIQSQIQQRVATYQKSFSDLEKELGSQQQELSRQQSILSQDVFSTRARELERRFNELREREQQANTALGQSRDKALLKIQDATKSIIDGVMKERGANLVLNRAAVLLIANARFDVTDEVLKHLDEKLPTMTVTFVEPGQGVAGAPGAKPNARKR